MASKKANIAPVTRGLAAYWGFDEGKGKVAADKSGNKLHGKIFGAKHVKAGRKWGLYFNGQNNWVDCGRSKLLNPRKAITLEAWVKPDGVFTSNLRGVMGKSRETFAFYQNPSNQYRLNITSFENLARSQPAQGEWIHAVGVFGGKRIKVYINGGLSADVVSAEDFIIEAKNFYIGYCGEHAHSDDEGYFQGVIDEVRVYRRALTAKEVKRNFEANRGCYPGVVAPSQPA